VKLGDAEFMSSADVPLRAFASPAVRPLGFFFVGVRFADFFAAIV
jgi:hypothetical protein